MIIIYSLGAIILALLIGAALMRKVYNVEKSIIVHCDVTKAMEHISDFQYYSQWNPWQQSDPTAASTITGAAGTVGHKYAWVGKKIGEGSLTLLSIDKKNIHFELEFLKPWKSKASDDWSFEAWGDGSETKIIWQNSGQLPWPIARLMGPLITKNLNTQFEQGLMNLKKMCEG